MSGTILSIGLLTGLLGAGAVVAENQIPLIKGSFSENYREIIPLAGDVRTGLLAGTDNDTIKDPELGVYLPERDDKLLCVKVTSQDGRYTAQGRYRFGPIRAGAHKLEFPTSKARVIRDYRYTELAVLAALDNGNGTCNETADILVVAYWGNPPPLTSMLLLANSGGDDVEILSEHEGVGTRCVNIGESDIPARAYNVVCQLSRTQSEHKSWKLEIRRHFFGVEQQRIPVQIEMP